MNDWIFALAWITLLVFAFSIARFLRKLGLATTHIRDLVHIGAGVWIFGWPLWSERAFPIAIAFLAFAGVAIVPLAARRFHSVGEFRDAIADADERWSGIVLYVFAYAVFTSVGFLVDAFVASVALACLSFGDGLGGAIGRRFGRHRFRVPTGKWKSLEGSLTVFIASTVAIRVIECTLDVVEPWRVAIVLGLVAASSEAAAPRATDNLVVPIAVACAAFAMG